MANFKEMTVKLHVPENIDIDGLYEYFLELSSQKIETIHEFIYAMLEVKSDSAALSNAHDFFQQVDSACGQETHRRIVPCDKCGDELGWGCGEYPGKRV